MNQIAVDFIRAHEGCKLQAYQDSVGIWTVGYGATGPLIGSHTIWTQEQADQDLIQRLGTLEEQVHTKTKGLLSEKQMAACISFAYNVGFGAFSSSTLLERALAKDWLETTKQFIEWDMAGGKHLKGLLARRLDEATLFLSGS